MFNSTKIINRTDEATGIVWGQKRGPVTKRVGERESDGKPIFATATGNIGTPFKVLDPNYAPDWSAGEISDGDKAMIGVMNGVAFTALGGIVMAIGGIIVDGLV